MSGNDKGRNKYLLKNTAIFAVGNFASKFISFFLVPLYTNCMVASEYGTADLLYTLCNFLIPLFTLNIVEAILMFSLDKNTNEKKIARIACTMIMPLIVAGALSIPIMISMDGYRNYALYFYAYMVTNAISQIFLITLKGQEKLKKFTVGNILHSVLIAIFSSIFLLWLKMGVGGYFLAYIVSNSIVAIYALIMSRALSNARDASFDKVLFKKMVKYSAVLIPTTFMWWIMNFLDRVMITGMINAAESGIYAVSYKIPTILSSVSSVFMQAWLFSAVKNSKTEDHTRYSNKIFNMLLGVLVGTSIILVMLVKEFFRIYVAPEYYEAWKYVPYLMVGHIFLTLSTFISTSYNVNKDSKGFLYSASIGAVVNLVLNAIMIPVLGASGAAIATTISYVCVFVYRIFDTKKYLVIKLTPRFYISIILVLATSIALVFSHPFDIIIGFIMLALFIVMNRKTIRAAFGPIKRLFKRFF